MHISKAVVSLALAASTASALPHCNDGQCANGGSGGNGVALAQSATRSQTQNEQTDGKDGQMKVVRTHLKALASGNNQQTNGQQQGGLQQTFSAQQQQQQGEQQPGTRQSLDFKKDGSNRDGGLNTAEVMGGSQTTGAAGTRGGFENQDGNDNGGSNMPKPKLQSSRRSSSTSDNAPAAKMMDQVQNTNQQQQQQQQQQYQQHLDQTDGSLIERFVKYLLSSGQTQQTQGNNEQNMQWDASGQNGQQQQNGGERQQGNTIRAVLGGGEFYPNNHGDGNGQYGKLVVSGTEGSLVMHGNYQDDPPHWLAEGAIIKQRSYLSGVAQLDMDGNNNNNNNGNGNGMHGGQDFTTTVRVNDQGEEEEGIEGQKGDKLQARQQTKGGQTINPYTGLPYWNGPLAFQKGDPSSPQSAQVQREEGSQSNIPTIVITQHTARAASGDNQQEGGRGGFQNTASSSPYYAHGDSQNPASSPPYQAHGNFQDPASSSPYHAHGDFQNTVVRVAGGGDEVPDIEEVPPAAQKFTTSSTPTTPGQQQNGGAFLGGIQIRDGRLNGAEEGKVKDGGRSTKVVLQHLDAGQGQQQQQQPQGEQKKGEDVEIGQVLAFCNEMVKSKGEGQQGLEQGQPDSGNLQMLLNCVKRVQDRFIVKA